MLDDLIGQYGVFGPAELRETLSEFLRRAAARIGPPNDQSTLDDPARMTVYALNLLDPSNWSEVSVQQNDGTQITALKYVPPEAERHHFERLQEGARERQTAASMQATIGLALDDPSRSSPEFAEAAVIWAQGAAATSAGDDTDAEWMRQQAVFAAAMIAMRDGDAALRSQHTVWARGIFDQALQTEDNSVHRFRSGLRFNPMAMAFVGMIHSLKDGTAPDHVRPLLDVAARENPAAAHGFGAAALSLATIDERLPRVVLRCAFAAAIRPSRQWDLPEGETARRADDHRKRVRAAVEAELAWLTGEHPEPEWPPFLPVSARTRRRHTIPGSEQQEAAPERPPPPEQEYTDHQAAALWLGKAISLADINKRPWLHDVARAYTQWTAAANGAGPNL